MRSKHEMIEIRKNICLYNICLLLCIIQYINCHLATDIKNIQINNKTFYNISKDVSNISYDSIQNNIENIRNYYNLENNYHEIDQDKFNQRIKNLSNRKFIKNLK